MYVVNEALWSEKTPWNSISIRTLLVFWHGMCTRLVEICSTKATSHEDNKDNWICVVTRTKSLFLMSTETIMTSHLDIKNGEKYFVREASTKGR